jgi:hypothetical protein
LELKVGQPVQQFNSAKSQSRPAHVESEIRSIGVISFRVNQTAFYCISLLFLVKSYINLQGALLQQLLDIICWPPAKSIETQFSYDLLEGFFLKKIKVASDAVKS